MSEKTAQKKLIKKIQDDHLFFYEEILGVTLWEKQKEISEKVENNRRTAIYSCNGAGKTWFIARLALRFLVAHPPALVINTAPTWRQIENQFWRYLRDAYNKSKYHIGGKLMKTQLNFKENWYALGIAADSKNVAAFQGFHGENVLVIFDEASGIPKPIWEAVEGLISGGSFVRFVAIGNLNFNTGDFVDTMSSDLYAKVFISAFDLPNVKEKKNVIPGLSTWEWVQEMIQKYGEDSDIYRVRVLGQPPKHGADNLISVGAIEAAFNSDREMYGEKIKRLGVDVARFGDDKTALVMRIGNYAEVVDVISKFDTMSVAGVVAKFLRDNKDFEAFIDITGGLGAGVFDRLREQADISGRVFGVNVAAHAKDTESYVNIRAESWDEMKLWLRDAILDKHEGFYQLASPKYKINSNGKIQLEGKEEMKKRGISSPDVGDALALTLSRPTESAETGLVWI